MRVSSVDQPAASPDREYRLPRNLRGGSDPDSGSPTHGRASEGHCSDRQPTRCRWFVSALALLLLLAIAPAGASLIELVVEAEDETEARVTGLEEALVQLAGLHSPAIDDLVSALLRAEDTRWLRSLERHGADRFLLAFDRVRLQTALEASEVPVWAGSRPALLFWVVTEWNGRRFLLGSGMDEEGVLEALRELASRRDLPLLFPLGDLEDRRQVHAADIIGGVVEALVEPSRRYEPDGLVLLHIFSRGDAYRARALITYRNQLVQSEASAASPTASAREAAAGAIDALGARMARVLTGDDALPLGFVGIAGMADLQVLRARLTGLQAVREVQLTRLIPDAAILDLRTGLDTFALAEVLKGEGFVLVDRHQETGDDVGLWFRPPR